MKICIIHSNPQYDRLYTNLGFELVHDFRNAEVVAFTGGEDVTPALYGAEAHPFTGNNPWRDDREKEIFNYCFGMAIPMIGICRGGQFLNVMSGGKMYQHVNEHTRDHYITDCHTGREVYASSTHHQMFMPGENAIILAISNLGGYREWYDGEVFKRDISNTDYEVIMY